jgi:mRNA interferase RelE/StbE
LKDLRHPQFRLRVDEIRVFYDVTETDVVIIAIMPKNKTIERLKEQGIR